MGKQQHENVLPVIQAAQAVMIQPIPVVRAAARGFSSRPQPAPHNVLTENIKTRQRINASPALQSAQSALAPPLIIVRSVRMAFSCKQQHRVYQSARMVTTQTPQPNAAKNVILLALYVIQLLQSAANAQKISSLKQQTAKVYA